MTLIQLLVVLLSIATAHAAPSKILLHNDTTLLEKSVVSNWTQLCQHLCSLNLSGPACGIDCSLYPVVENVEDFNIISSENHDATLCTTLCENGLGVNKCDCKMKVQPSSLALSKSMMPDKRKICFDFCRFRRVTLKGCSPCSSHFLREFDSQRRSENQVERERKEERENSLPSPVVAVHPPRQSLSAPPLSLPEFPNAHRVVVNHHVTTDATTPDWNKVCTQLCRNGSGGLLCNCDLPPF